MSGEKVLRNSAVTAKLGVGRTTLWRLIRAGDFPAPRQVTPTVIGWLESEVDRWLADRPTATGGDRGRPA